MWPGSSVSGLYIGHPDAYYFGVAKVERDQVADYAARKGMALERGRTLARAGPELQPAERRESGGGIAVPAGWHRLAAGLWRARIGFRTGSPHSAWWSRRRRAAAGGGRVLQGQRLAGARDGGRRRAGTRGSSIKRPRTSRGLGSCAIAGDGHRPVRERGGGE